MKPMRSGGGWAAIAYTWRMARRVGIRRLWDAMRAKNACKTCALGMGGQAGGMRNELGHWPEVCKKSLQATVADMQAGLRPEFFARYSIAELQALSPRELEWCGRLTTPLFAGPGDTHYRVIEWGEAFRRITDHLRESGPNRTFFYASGRSSNEAGFLLQLFARIYGTNFVNNCSYYCHQASGVGLTASIGTGTATVTLDDLERTDLFFLIGGNPASNHPRLMRTLANIRGRGGNVIVVNPVKEVGLVSFRVPSDPWSLIFGSRIANVYVQPHIGGDIAFLTGVAKHLLETDAVDRGFITKATEGFQEFVGHVAATDWSTITAHSGVDRQTIEQVARIYQKAKSAVFGWTMGITHHEHGVANVQTIANLALMRGMIGRRGAGLLPIRGHSNVQGLGSVGVVPNLKQSIIDNLERTLGVKLPTTPGLDTMACIQASARGEMAAALCLGGNLFGSNPHSQFAAEALGKLKFIAYLNTTLNTGHAWGRAEETLILPVLARDEESEPTTQESMFSFVRLSDGGPGRLVGPRSEVEILSQIAGQVLDKDSPISWHDLRRHCHVRELIGRIIPGMESMRELDHTKKEFHVGGRVLHQPRFPTATGKARFVVHPLPRFYRGTQALRLMTVRSEGQFNTVVYEDADIYRGQERRDVILMNPRDIASRGLRIDQRVTVRSSVGELHHILVRAFDIRAGNALMYFPEANVLVPPSTDPLSKTPSFKSVWVTVTPTSETGRPRESSNGRKSLEIVR
jgi:molybdopterin-dependent oxidoreductase alpha subunit